MWQALVGAVAGAMTMFGGASSTGDHRPPRPDMQGKPSSTRELRKDFEGRMGDRASSTLSTANISCISAAVATRETSLVTAITTLNSDMSSAYSARASALASAYTQSGNDVIKAAVKSAWQQFEGAAKASRKSWQLSRTTTWTSFKAALKACGGNSSSLSDAGSAGSEISGQ